MVQPCVPALPNTWLVSHDEKREPLPVFAWAITNSGAMPICPAPHTGLHTGDAYLLPDGDVFDPITQTNFGSVSEWRGFVESDKPYELDQPVGTGPVRDPAVAATKAPKAAKPAPRAVGGGVVFSGKLYKNKSFWHYTGQPECVFLVEPNNPTPEGEGIEKIKRDDFYELRKTISEIEADDLGSWIDSDGAAAGKPAASDEPEQFDDEDDDGSDLV